MREGEDNGAHNRIRTGDLFLTKEVLYLLSYVGLLQKLIGCGFRP
jgi:hypothetical protein